MAVDVFEGGLLSDGGGTFGFAFGLGFDGLAGRHHLDLGQREVHCAGRRVSSLLYILAVPSTSPATNGVRDYTKNEQPRQPKTSASLMPKPQQRRSNIMILRSLCFLLAILTVTAFSVLPVSRTFTSLTPLRSSSSTEDIALIDNVAAHCQVKPSHDFSSRPWLKKYARWTWRRRDTVLKILHWRDTLTPVDSCINLECLWWKALSTTDPSSPCYEASFPYTYSLLPKYTRRLIKSLRWLHPRWIHSRLEVRQAYLNGAVAAEARNHAKVRIISLGAGYDARSIRILNDELHKDVECYEIDLPSTVESKRKLFGERLCRQNPRPWKLPTLIGLDLNDTDKLRQELSDIIAPIEDTTRHTIFVVEGVLMYLDEGKAAAALAACAQACRGGSSLCFSDRFPVENDEVETMQVFLAETGWDLIEWAPNPEANAKHMGVARLVGKD